MADEDDPKDPELDLDEPTETEPEPEPEPDEPEAEAESEPEPVAASPESESAPEQPQRPSRRDTRIQSLVESNRQKDTELAEVRRRLDELTQRVAQPKPQAETPEQRAQRRALMTPQEVMMEELSLARQEFGQQVQGLQAQNAETADRMAFQAQCAVNPLYAKYAPKVEGKLAEMRVTGANAPRETVLAYLIGKAALDRYSSKEGKREVAQAQTRVKRATVRPPNSGSDTAATRRREESLERRLENQQI